MLPTEDTICLFQGVVLHTPLMPCPGLCLGLVRGFSLADQQPLAISSEFLRLIAPHNSLCNTARPLSGLVFSKGNLIGGGLSTGLLIEGQSH